MAKAFLDLIWDYLVFIILIIFSSVIPLWSTLRGGKKENTKAAYVFGAGSVSIAAMMLSIARGTLGVRSFLGYPSELFYRGSAMWETIYGMVNAYPIVIYVFLPVYFSLGITSVYQYLDLRFKSRLVRCLASFTYIARQIMNLGVTVYTPSVALNTIIGIPYWVSLLGMTLISILFTVLGGLKAAITADVIQGLTMIAVSIAVIAQSAWEAGGVEQVYTANRDSGRLKFLQFTGDMTTRVDTTSAWLGQLFMSLSLFGCQQNFVQRYVSMKSLKDVKRTLQGNIPVIIVLFSLSWIAGMGIYATYADCDPLTAGYTKKMDEILPFFVEDKFAYMPGILGLFMATLFNGALSLNVSNLNSLATVTWEDFISPLPHFKGKTDKQQLTIIKLLGCMYGVLVMGVAFSVGLLSGVIESSMLMTSATSGPLLGVFLLAMLCPMANWKGASIGMILSHIITIWLTFGSFSIEKPPIVMLPTSIEGCSNDTFSSGITKPLTPWLLSSVPLEVGWDIHNTSFLTSTQTPVADKNFVQNLYSVSYMYYAFVGTMITVLVGIAVSYITASDEDAYDSKLLHPAIYRFSTWLPGKDRLYSNVSTVEPEISTNNKTNNKTSIEIHDNYAFEMKSEIPTITGGKTVNGFKRDSVGSTSSFGLHSVDLHVVDDPDKTTGSRERSKISSSSISLDGCSPSEIYKRINEDDISR